MYSLTKPMEKLPTTGEQPLMNQALEILEYINNQRIFFIGTPLVSQFNYLVCGYNKENYNEILKAKINNDKND